MRRILQRFNEYREEFKTNLTVNHCFLSYFIGALYMNIEDATQINMVGAQALVFIYIDLHKKVTHTRVDMIFRVEYI